MRKVLVMVFAAMVFAAPAWAVPESQLVGFVYCDSNGNGQIDSFDTPLADVRVRIASADGAFTWSALTDTAGYYALPLAHDPAISYTFYVVESSLAAGSTIVLPGGGTQTFVGPGRIDVLIANPNCIQQQCWLTAGGAKFSAVTGTMVAEHGPKHSFGGNVNPGCNVDSGEGGQWNHVAHALKLHFQGFVVRVVRCGNVANIPPGSESPVTPYNFIEFEGSGRLMGIAGNKTNENVYFWARAEDRNEPGSSGAKDGALVDRYMLHVFANPADRVGSTRLLLDIDGNPATVDPITITDGNLQLHISSCSNPPQ